MIVQLVVPDSQLDSRLGRVSPVIKLGIAFAWLAGLALTTDARPPMVLALVGVVAAVTLGAVPVSRFARGAAPLAIAAGGIAVFSAVFSTHNADPAAVVAVALGPLRITTPALLTAVGLFARIVAIGTTAVTFSQTTDSTRLVDSLVRQAGVSPRFGYGALAAYQSIPRLADDLGALRASRRIRGMRWTWHPRLLLGLLVRAIRQGDALALAMDARAFGLGERTWYRDLRWQPRDLVAAIAGLVLLVVALMLAR